MKGMRNYLEEPNLLLIGVTEFTLIFSTPKLLPGKQGIRKETKGIQSELHTSS